MGLREIRNLSIAMWIFPGRPPLLYIFFLYSHLSEGDQGINIKVFPLGQTALAQESPLGGGQGGTEQEIPAAKSVLDQHTSLLRKYFCKVLKSILSQGFKVFQGSKVGQSIIHQRQNHYWKNTNFFNILFFSGECSPNKVIFARGKGILYLGIATNITWKC